MRATLLAVTVLCCLLCGHVYSQTLPLPAVVAEKYREITPAHILASVRIGDYGGCSGTIIAIGPK